MTDYQISQSQFSQSYNCSILYGCLYTLTQTILDNQINRKQLQNKCKTNWTYDWVEVKGIEHIEPPKSNSKSIKKHELRRQYS